MQIYTLSAVLIPVRYSPQLYIGGDDSVVHYFELFEI